MSIKNINNESGEEKMKDDQILVNDDTSGSKLSVRFYSKKELALAAKNETQILISYRFKSFGIMDHYSDFLEYIKSCKNPELSEYIFEVGPVNLFYDLDIKSKDHPTEYSNSKDIVSTVIQKTEEFLKKSFQVSVRTTVLKSHTKKKIALDLQKKSYHITFHLSSENNNPVYIKSVHVCKLIAKGLFPDYTKKKIVDTSVHREGCFRSIYSSKEGERRPLIHCKLGDQPINDMDSFVQYCPDLSLATLICKSDVISLFPSGGTKKVFSKKSLDSRISPPLINPLRTN